ncbi:MAG: glycosyltransferase family 4 protein [Candidatus Sumerlaeia bacterium]
MKIVYVTAGSGRWECDACLRDGDLARELKKQGHEVLFVPTYTPLIIEDAKEVASRRIFYGGINVYLRHRFSFMRHMPSLLLKIFDQPWILRLASRMEDMTDAKSLAQLTISVLQGEHGAQRKELMDMIQWLQSQMQPDAFVLPNSMFAGFAEPARRQLNCPVLCLLSGEDGFIDLFPEPERSECMKILREQSNKVDRFIVPNAYYRGYMADYLQIPEARFDIVPQCVNPEYYKPAEKAPEPFTIAFRHAMCPNNGLHILLEAWRLLRQDEELPPCRVRASGHLSGSDKPWFEAQLRKVREWGLADDFEYVGELVPEARGKFLAEANVLSVPVIYPEPIAMFVPEALISGIPAVLPRRGALTEWIEETGGGILVEPDNPEALALGIREIMLNPEKAKDMAEKGRQKVLADYTLEKMASSLVQAVQKAR